MVTAATRLPSRISAKERTFRRNVVQKARQLSLATGYVLSARLEKLCCRFIDGELSREQFSHEITKPYIN